MPSGPYGPILKPLFFLAPRKDYLHQKIPKKAFWGWESHLATLEGGVTPRHVLNRTSEARTINKTTMQ